MPNSKRRKRHVEATKREVEKARRRLRSRACEAAKENRGVLLEEEEQEICPRAAEVGGLPAGETEIRRESKDLEFVEEENNPGSWKSWVGGLYGWCHTGLTQVGESSILSGPSMQGTSPSPPLQGVSAAKDAVFPSRALKRQLEEAQQRLREMEEEMELLKGRERKRRRRNRVSLHSWASLLHPLNFLPSTALCRHTQLHRYPPF